MFRRHFHAADHDGKLGDHVADGLHDVLGPGRQETLQKRERHMHKKKTLRVQAAQFEKDCGSKQHPDIKHLSMQRARVLEAQRHPRKEEEIPVGPTAVDEKTGVVEHDGWRYSKFSICGRDSNVGLHDCFRKHTGESALGDYGTGIVLYFKYLKFMGFLLFFLCLTQMPALLIYGSAGAAVDLIEGKGSVKSLVVTTLGNMGGGTTICHEGAVNEPLTFDCPTHQGTKTKIRRIEAAQVLVGDVRGSCQCPGTHGTLRNDPTKCSPLDYTSGVTCPTGDYCYHGYFPLGQTQETCCSDKASLTGKPDFSDINPHILSSPVAGIVADSTSSRCVRGSFGAQLRRAAVLGLV